MRLRTIATALALMMAMTGIAHAESWAHWKRHHPLHLRRAPRIDPDHITTRDLARLVRFERVKDHRQRKRWLAYRAREASLHTSSSTMAAPSSAGWSVSSIDALIISVFGNNAEALRVADCESGDNPYAHNASGASGVFQLMPEWWAGRFNPYDALANIREAYRISGGGTDWSGWLCR